MFSFIVCWYAATSLPAIDYFAFIDYFAYWRRRGAARARSSRRAARRRGAKWRAARRGAMLCAQRNFIDIIDYCHAIAVSFAISPPFLGFRCRRHSFRFHYAFTAFAIFFAELSLPLPACHWFCWLFIISILFFSQITELSRLRHSRRRHGSTGRRRRHWLLIRLIIFCRQLRHAFADIFAFAAAFDIAAPLSWYISSPCRWAAIDAAVDYCCWCATQPPLLAYFHIDAIRFRRHYAFDWCWCRHCHWPPLLQFSPHFHFAADFAFRRFFGWLFFHFHDIRCHYFRFRFHFRHAQRPFRHIDGFSRRHFAAAFIIFDNIAIPIIADYTLSMPRITLMPLSFIFRHFRHCHCAFTLPLIIDIYFRCLFSPIFRCLPPLSRQLPLFSPLIIAAIISPLFSLRFVYASMRLPFSFRCLRGK